MRTAGTATPEIYVSTENNLDKVQGHKTISYHSIPLDMFQSTTSLDLAFNHTNEDVMASIASPPTARCPLERLLIRSQFRHSCKGSPRYAPDVSILL